MQAGSFFDPEEVDHGFNYLHPGKERPEYTADEDGIHLKVFLDTNIVFSILGYHHPWISTLARELFIMLQENKFDLYVLDFTLDEIRRVLSTYKNANYSGRRKIRVASMRSRLRNLGISNVEIMKSWLTWRMSCWRNIT